MASLFIFAAILVQIISGPFPLHAATANNSPSHPDLPKNVLILNSHDYDIPWQQKVNNAIYAAFNAAPHLQVNLHAEFTGLSQKYDEKYTKKLFDLYSHKYNNRPLDLVIAVDIAAVNFLKNYREKLFSEVPIVFVTEKQKIEGIGLLENMTGLLSEVNVSGTLKVALSLHPDTQHIAVVSGASQMDRLYEAKARQVFQEYEQRFDFIYLTGLPTAEIMDTVSQLPDKTILFYILTLVDGAGEPFTPKQVVSQISQVANAPLYGLWDTFLGSGIVGGCLVSAEQEGATIAEMALSILKGKKAADIPVTLGSHRYMFDWRQLQRWKIDTRNLSPDSEVRYKVHTFWELYKLHIIGVAILLIAETFLIISLLIHRARRHKAEDAHQKTLADLDIRVKDRTSALIKINEQLQGEITKREKISKSLAESERWLKGVFHSLNEAVLIVSPDRCLVKINKSAEKIFGYSQNEIQNLSTEVFHIDKEHYLEFGRRINTAFEQNPIVSFEFEAKRKNGEIFPTFHTVHHLTGANGEYLGIVSIVQDLTKVKQAEAALKESEYRFREIFHKMGSGVAIYEVTNDGNDFIFKDMNPAGERYSKVKRDDIIGKNVIDVFPGIVPMGLFEVFKQVWRTDNPESHPITLYKDDRLQHWVDNYVFKLPSGEIVAVYNDITERKKMEEELFQAHKMEAIGTLAGGIAHDFNNILAAILGYADMAREKLQTASPVRNDIDQVLKAGNRARELVKRILTFCHKGEEELILLPLSPLIKEAVKLIRASLPTTAEIRLEIDPDCGLILAAPTGIHQVLVNLCTNALHALYDEKGIITISLKPVYLSEYDIINEPSITAGQFVELRVSDTGCGMEKEVLAKIFEPYFTTKETGKGTGFGLALVHSIVQNFGGFINVESTLGAGSSFHVYFPATNADREEVEKEHKESIPRGTERVLIVDDEKAVVDMYRTTLEDLGYKVTATHISQEALELFKASPDNFDLVLTDQTMPHLSGIDLAKEILLIKPDIPIILCTGFSSLITRDKTKEIGIKKFIMKPLSRKEIATIVREILDERAGA